MDVIIAYDKGDLEFVEKITEKIKCSGVNVWYQKANETDLTSQKLISSKIFVVVLSEKSAVNNELCDLTSLAYISNKTVVPVARKYYRSLAELLTSGLKLILAKINWVFFVKEEDYESSLSQLIELFLDHNHKSADDTDFETANMVNDKIPDFWDRNFQNLKKVNWGVFSKSFIDDYGEKIECDFGCEAVPIFTDLIWKDIFLEEMTAEKNTYLKFLDKNINIDGNEFYEQMRKYVTQYTSMKEVLDMNSTVRLTAIQNLGLFQTNTVIDILIGLVRDDDANIRAISALSLVKSGRNDERIGPLLIQMLHDEDRLVRESACLSLAHMRHQAAVNCIIDLWRNDPIKNVREAAELALQRLGGEATVAMKTTQVIIKAVALLNELS